MLAGQTAVSQPVFSHPDRIRYDGHCFTIEGKDTFLFSGAFHYFRCPRELWRDRFQKIKDAGFNAVETYVAWNWSEQVKPKGPSDTSRVDLSDLDAWLTMAEDEFGLYTIVRPGPYICSEWASGGFPNWLPAFKPAQPLRTPWYRSDDPVFEEWSKHWYTEVAKVVGKHQLSKRPAGKKGVILWQVENEYDFAGLPDEARRNYVRFLIETSRKLGIEVPIFGCWTSPIRFPKGDKVLADAYDNPNCYPRWDIESTVGAIKAQHDAQPWAPKMVTEFQGGWFGGVGGLSAAEQDGIDTAQTSSNTLLAIANGLTGLNYYMLFGGTNFGDWAGEGITTSYDYAAPIREWGGVGDKYQAVQAIGRMLQKYGQDLARSEEAQAPASGKKDVKVYARKGASGATYLFLWNKDRKETETGMLDGGPEFSLAPFATAIYRYDADLRAGEWLIKGDTPSGNGPALTTKGIRLTIAEQAEGEPTAWKEAPGARGSTTDLGVWDSRLIFYRVPKVEKEGSMWLQISKECDFFSPGLPQPDLRQGGLTWPVQPLVGVLFNQGWPNGGNGMEAPHGVLQARLFGQLPQGQTLTMWKSKRLSDPEDRSLVGPDVDTSGWDPDADASRFPENTSVVCRADVELSEDPKPETVLETDGVDDYGDFYVNGEKVGHISEYGVPASFPVGKVLHKGHNVIVVVIHNNGGPGGFTGATGLMSALPASQPLPLQWTTEIRWGKPLTYLLDSTSDVPTNEHPKVSGTRTSPSGRLVGKTTVRFVRPGSGPWQMVLQATGDGFLYLNGRALGRFWQVGPQRGFYLPEPWLKDANVLEYVAIPGKGEDQKGSPKILAAELRPMTP